MEKLAYQNFNYLDKTFNFTIGSLVGTFFLDQIGN
jgi:hypothetical protein